MSRPIIPLRILRSVAEVLVCTGTDDYQNQVYEERYIVYRVHLQPTAQIVKTATNTDQQLKATLFADCRASTPNINWADCLRRAHQRAGDVRVIVRGFEYTVAAADLLRDDTDAPHHWEISLY